MCRQRCHQCNFGYSAVVTLDSTNITCNGLIDGTATATVTGGTPNYTYLWNDDNAETTATATNLSSGTYTVSVTDDNNCSTTGSISIAEPTLLNASFLILTL